MHSEIQEREMFNSWDYNIASMPKNDHVIHVHVDLRPCDFACTYLSTAATVREFYKSFAGGGKRLMRKVGADQEGDME